MSTTAFGTYREELNRQLATGSAVERSHYPALKTLIEAVASAGRTGLGPVSGDGREGRPAGITVTIEATGEVSGIPDLKVTRGPATLGFVECKDLGAALGEVERTEQLKRYRGALPNLVLTNFLEFRWYKGGEFVRAATLGTKDERGKVHMSGAGAEEVGLLLRDFLESEVLQVGTAADLAKRLAHQAQGLRDAARGSFQTDGKPLESLRRAFETTLLPNLSPEDFADMYAQTLAYGLFAACFELRREQAGAHFDRREASWLLPKTNPFLKDLFHHLVTPGMPQEVDFWLAEIESLLNHTDLSEIGRDFAHRLGREDPVVHFYETFLREYDPKRREVRGVYYTPEPVVSYIVRSIDWLLKEKFGKRLGLADESVYILDPACGTGTFLFETIKVIHATVVREQGKGAWNGYVREKLLPRLFGFELLMAPYTIAHMKLAIELRETGYDFAGDERLGIYLTNTLEEARERVQQVLGYEELEKERRDADAVKRHEEIMVVLGNPPYSVYSANKNRYIDSLMETYKHAVRSETQIAPLADDYIKFIRFAHERIDQTGHGIVGMITNHTWLSGLIHRGMREELLRTFTRISALDLHGNSRFGERPPQGQVDENVFDIQQGVAIWFLELAPDSDPGSKVQHDDLWGTRSSKYAALSERSVADGPWRDLTPTAPFFFFVPKDLRLQDEYDNGWRVADAFPAYVSGVQTKRDEFVIDMEREALEARMRDFGDSARSDAEVARRYRLHDTRDWSIANARGLVRAEAQASYPIVPCVHRVFDLRFMYYSGSVIEYPRAEMRHLLSDNLALVSTRRIRTPDFSHVSVAATVVNKVALSSMDDCFVFPLYLYPSEGTLEVGAGRRANLNPQFVAEMEAKLGLRFIPDGQGDLTQTFGPEDVFYYAYAVFHSPTYRERYAELLKIDFPRLPLTSDRALFAKLVAKGKRLVALHLMREEGRVGERPRFPVGGEDGVERVRYVEAQATDETPVPLGRVYINPKQYFEGVEKEVWEFHIGGYQVCEKWLKDRKGRKLSHDDISHYQKIVLALRETREIMREIDEIIPGWPLE